MQFAFIPPINGVRFLAHIVKIGTPGELLKEEDQSLTEA